MPNSGITDEGDEQDDRDADPVLRRREHRLSAA